MNAGGFLHDKTTIYNDNMAWVLWSKITKTEGLSYLQIRENTIRENQNIIKIQHIAGKINPSDMFSNSFPFYKRSSYNI